MLSGLNCLIPKHADDCFYTVVGKWFAPCGKCEECWGRRAWVIGQLSWRGDGSPAFESWTQTFVYSLDRGAERHQKGKMVGRNTSLHTSPLHAIRLIHTVILVRAKMLLWWIWPKRYSEQRWEVWTYPNNDFLFMTKLWCWIFPGSFACLDERPMRSWLVRVTYRLRRNIHGSHWKSGETLTPSMVAGTHPNLRWDLERSLRELWWDLVCVHLTKLSMCNLSPE